MQPQQTQSSNQFKVADTTGIMNKIREKSGLNGLKYEYSVIQVLPEQLPTTEPLLQVGSDLSLTQSTISILKNNGYKGPLKYKGTVFYLLFEKETNTLDVFTAPAQD